MFSEEKVAQMTAYLLSLSGGRESYLKILKMLYLADRDYLGRFGISISGDAMVAMPHGPVLSQTYDCCKGGGEGGWSNWIKGEANYEIGLKRAVLERDDLDELNDVQIETLRSIHEQYRHMSRWEIRDYTHNHCDEWEDPQGSSWPISPESVFVALGKSPDEVKALTSHLAERKQLEQIIHSS
ncbi:MAG: Panacea domain-containing protein [Cellvibrionaceae bacterium]|nr:Panacea domain-containing protein [Cellvibrionaceae bacterium]